MFSVRNLFRIAISIVISLFHPEERYLVIKINQYLVSSDRSIYCDMNMTNLISILIHYLLQSKNKGIFNFFQLIISQN